MSNRQTRRICYDFRGAVAPPAVASRQGAWCSKITAAGGSPTIQSGTGGAMELTLDNTNEAQNLCLYMGDVLAFDIDEILRVEFLAKISASLDATVQAAIGLASARNDAIDTIAEAVLFRCVGANTLVVESDDGTNNNDDKATGQSLEATYKRLAIDFATGHLTQSPPSASLGGLADVRFAVSNQFGSLQRVAEATRFDVSNYSGGLQLFAQLQKTAGVATGTFSILEAVVDVSVPG